ARVQALVERGGRSVSLIRRRSGEEVVEQHSVAVARRVQRGGDVPEPAIRRVGDAVERQRIEQLRPEPIASHDGCQIGYAGTTAPSAEHALDGRELNDA